MIVFPRATDNSASKVLNSLQFPYILLTVLVNCFSNIYKRDSKRYEVICRLPKTINFVLSGFTDRI